MKISKIKFRIKTYRDQFGSDLIAYDDTLKTKKQFAEVINTQIRHNQDRQNADQRQLENLARELGLDL